MRVILRFFINDEDRCIASININNYTGLIPQRGSQVCLEEILNNDHIDFDYFIVRELCYSYGIDSTLVDIFVNGEYWD